MPKIANRKSAGTKGRGRTNITGKTSTHPNPPIVGKTEVNRPTSSAHRGDRRDMHRQYTGTTKHSARGKTGRLDRSTRKD